MRLGHVAVPPPEDADFYKAAYRQACDREHVLETKVRRLELELAIARDQLSHAHCRPEIPHG